MARTLLAGERTTLGAARVRHDFKVEVQNGDGTWIDYSTYHIGGNTGESRDNPVQGATVFFRRAAGTSSLAPLMTASPLNVYSGGYAPAIEKGRRIRISSATVGPGVTPSGGDYREIFAGRVDEVDWAADPITVQCSDEGAWLMDTQIETETQYGTAGGQAVQTAIQNILNGWPSGKGVPTLYVPTSPGWNIKLYTQLRVKVLEAIRDLGLQIAWDLRFRYDASHVSKLTLMDPDRTSTTVHDTIGPTEYTEVRRLSMGIAGIRNVGKVNFWKADGTAGTATYSDASTTASINKNGRRYFELPATRNLDAQTEADKYVKGVTLDLVDSVLDQEIEMLYYWPVQLYDRYTFTANGVHYNADQTLAVQGYQHAWGEGFATTTLQVAGRVIGAYDVWIQRMSSVLDLGRNDFVNKDVDHVDDGIIFKKSPQYSSSGDNGVDNANFEASSALELNAAPPGWRPSDATLSYETSTPYSGTRSLKVVAPAQYGAAISLRKWKVRPGEVWQISAAAKSLAGKIADAQLMFMDAAGTYISGVQPTTTSAAWVIITNTGTVPAGAVFAQISLQVNDVGGGTAYFDDLVVLRMRAATESTPRDRCKLHRSANQTITTITNTNVAWDVEDWDVGALHAPGDNTKISVPGGPGTWLFACNIEWASNATGYRSVVILKNGSTIIANMLVPPANGIATAMPLMGFDDNPAAGDYYQVVVNQSSGGNLDVVNSGATYFSATHLW